MIQLDNSQKQTVYQLLLKRGLEGYRKDVELLLTGQYSPADTLKLLCCLIDERERLVVEGMTARENSKLEKLNRLYPGICFKGITQ